MEEGDLQASSATDDHGKRELDEVPPYFLCPISLQIMKDPVTVATGVTYDRPSIARWLSGATAYHRATCPVTNQPIADRTLTPNLTLLRLIRSWRSSSSAAVSPASKPTPVLDVAEVIQELLHFGGDGVPELQLRVLKKARVLIEEDDDNRVAMEEAEIAPLVASMIITKPSSSSSFSDAYFSDDSAGDVSSEAAWVLQLLKPPNEMLRRLAERNDGEFIGALSSLLLRGTYKARIHSIGLLRLILKAVAVSGNSSDRHHQYRIKGVEVTSDLFDGAVEMLKDHNSSRATTMSLLSILAQVLPFGTNRSKAVEAGAVAVLVELLVEVTGNDQRRCEAMLCLLETMCGKAEGRGALLGHPAGVAAVSGKVLAVSPAATRMAVKVLLLLCRFCGAGVAEEMVAVGAVGKLCMVVQVEGGTSKAGRRAKEILGMHMKEWHKSPCFPLVCLP